MKKTIIVLIFILAFGLGASGEPMDLVLVLDTSASMSDSYRETSDYLIGPFLREFLRIGDTFHLISFSGSPRLEISRRVEGIGDIEAIIGRLLLMYPLEPESNLTDALSFTENFTSSLSGAKPKKIVLLTDVSANDDTQSLINQTSERLQSLGADLQYIKSPVTGTGPSSGRPREYISSTPPPVTTTPPATTATTPATTTPPATTTTPPATTTTPPATTTTPPATTTPPVTTPRTGETSSRIGTFFRSIFQGGFPLRLLILILLNLLVLGLILFFAARNLHKSPDRAVARAAVTNTKPLQSPVSYAEARQSPAKPSQSPVSYAEARQSPAKLSQSPVSYAEAPKTQARPQPESSPPKRKPLPKDKAYEETSEESLMLNLFVADQNTAIGRRNIHLVKAGHKFGIGGGKSDFLIFLVPIPPNIAELLYDGRNCTLTPKKPQYFPDLGSRQVPACIGKNIRVVSDRNYELYIRIEKYEDPLKALNRLMNSISVPGERR